MVELHAYQDGKDLMLKPEKYIDVELASFKKTDGYELYYLNDSANWNVTNKFNNIENSRKKLKLKNLTVPVSPNPEESIQDLIFEMVTNLNDVPYLKSFENLKWKIDRRNISEEVLEAMRVNWDDVAIKEINKRKLKYELVFTKSMRDFSSNTITKTFKVNASPVFNKNEKRAFKNDFAEKMKSYEVDFAKYTEEKLRLEREADMVNQFRINKMGIWNVDKIMNDAELLITNISFDFEKEIDPSTNHIMTYVIYEDNNSVIPYLPKDLKKVGILKNKKMKILAILPNNKIAIVNDDEIKAQLKISADRLFLKTVKASAEEYLKSPLSPPRGKFSKSS
jgi:CRISPR/Cas system-associated protein Cas5 (RAMP superfamily)